MLKKSTMDSNPQKIIIGRLEEVDIPALGLRNIEAKIDTGAYSGAIHVSSVEEFEKNGKTYIRFRVLDEDHPEYSDVVHETDIFQQKRIRNSTGEATMRYLVPVCVHIKGLEINTKLSLSNRKDLRYPILIGRKILKKGKLIVDVSKN